MKQFLIRVIVPAVLIISLGAWVIPAQAQPKAQGDDPVARGKYLATVAGCEDCHTPIDERGLSVAGREFAGGYPFPLGPLGTVFTKNLTPDKETGLGNWTDDEIKRAIRSGVSRDGLHLFPVMPYKIYNNMAESDINDIIAYLRSLKPINNPVERKQILPVEALPEVPVQSGIVAPAPTDTAARGRYLIGAVIACTDCHTPIDSNTGQPIMEKYLAGGQPYEGPWGIVYSANLTPDEKTGLKRRTDAEISRVLHEGILVPDDPARPNQGRRAILMPWRPFSNLTEDDTKAVIHFLRNDLKPVENLVPAASLKPDFIEYVAVETPTLPATVTSSPIGMIIGVIVVVVFGAAVVYYLMRRQSNSSSTK